MTDPNTPKKITKVSELTSNMNRGSQTDEVKVLQAWLAANGYPEVKPDGIYGPVTENAVKQFQKQNGLTPDGSVGPQTRAKMSTFATSTDTPGKSQAEIDADYAKSLAAHPEFAGNSQTTLDNAIATGDFSNILNSQGKPFSQADQDAALKKAEGMDANYWDQSQNYDTQNTQDILAKDQLDYNKYLEDQGVKFQEDKNTLDQNAADQGVLFSGGRAQKEQKLGQSYNSDQAYKQASLGNSMAGTARDFQYKYGNQPANNLSKYYSLGSNNYNTGVATNGATKGTLASMYNPGGVDYYGTEQTKKKASNLKTAAGLLWNKGNKIVGTGMNNQYK